GGGGAGAVGGGDKRLQGEADIGGGDGVAGVGGAADRLAAAAAAVALQPLIGEARRRRARPAARRDRHRLPHRDGAGERRRDHAGGGAGRGRDPRAGGGGGGGGAGAVGGGDKRLQGEADIGGGDGVAKVFPTRRSPDLAAAAVALQPLIGEARRRRARPAARRDRHRLPHRDGA